MSGAFVRFAPGREHDLAGLPIFDPAKMRGLAGAEAVSAQARHSLVLRVARGNRPALFWKGFKAKSPLVAVKMLFRSSARRAWAGAKRLERLGLKTAALVAWGRPGRNREGVRSFIVTEEVGGGRSIDATMRAFRFGASDEARAKFRLLRSMGAQVARMHRAGCYHADLRLNNILWRNGAYGEPELFFIDTDRVLHRRLGARRETLRNLAQLGYLFVPGLTLTDRARILDAYAEEVSLSRAERRRLAGEAIRALRRRIEQRRNAILGDPVQQRRAGKLAEFLRQLDDRARVGTSARGRR